MKKIISKFWEIYTFSEALVMKMWFFECRLSVCMYKWMCSPPNSTRTVCYILFIFSIQECIYHRSMHSESEHSISKNRGSSIEQQNTKWLFFWKRFWLNFSNSWSPNLLVTLHSWHLQENKGMCSRGSNAKCQFSQKLFNGSNGFRCCPVFSKQQWSIKKQSASFPR
jgi:hypothetical protein